MLRIFEWLLQKKLQTYKIQDTDRLELEKKKKLQTTT